MREVIQRALGGERVEFTIKKHKYVAEREGEVVEIFRVQETDSVEELIPTAKIHTDTKVVETDNYEIATAIEYSPFMDEYREITLKAGETELKFEFYTTPTFTYLTLKYGKVLYNVTLTTTAGAIAEVFGEYIPDRPDLTRTLSIFRATPQAVHEALKTRPQSERDIVRVFFSLRKSPKRFVSRLVREGYLPGKYVTKHCVYSGNVSVNKRRNVAHIQNVRIPLELLTYMPHTRTKLKEVL